MFASILVGLDGSIPSQLALAQAMVTAGQFRSRVILVHVARTGPDGTPAPGPISAPWMERRPGPVGPHTAEHAIREMLEDAAGAIRRAGLQASTQYTVGNPVEVLRVMAEQVSLVIVGRAGLTDEDDQLGVDTRELIRRTPCPVLVAGASPSSMDRCLVAFGGGSLSDQALTYAARFADIAQAHLDVVHVNDDLEAGRANLARANQALSLMPLRFETHLLRGPLEEALPLAARELHANVVFAGTSREGLHQLVPAYIEAILRATDVPVLVHTQANTASVRTTGAYRRVTSG
jgi:nucleotide-binding universal stress UspA family protein